MARGVTVKDARWRKLREQMGKIADGEPHVKVGILASHGAAEDRGGITQVGIAAVNEFGSEAAGVPERSFLRRTMDEKRDLFTKLTASLAAKVVKKGMPIEQALGQLGAVAAAEVKKTITVGAGVPPPNAASTIARKGSDRPLVDTGRMVDAIAHEVVSK